MEMEHSLESARADPNQYGSLELMLLSDWVMRKKGTRYRLAEYLKQAEFSHASTM